jgi:hypothetical protein
MIIPVIASGRNRQVDADGGQIAQQLPGGFLGGQIKAPLALPGKLGRKQGRHAGFA